VVIKGLTNLHIAQYGKIRRLFFEICDCCRFQFGVDDGIELENGGFLTIRDALNIYCNIGLSFDIPVFMTEYYPREY